MAHEERGPYLSEFFLVYFFHVIPLFFIRVCCVFSSNQGPRPDGRDQRPIREAAKQSLRKALTAPPPGQRNPLRT